MKSLLAEQRRKFLEQRENERKEKEKEEERLAKIKRFRGPSILVIEEASFEGSDAESAEFYGEEDQEALFREGEFELKVVEGYSPNVSPKDINKMRSSLKAKKKKEAF